jgi:hypothetical protein
MSCVLTRHRIWIDNWIYWMLITTKDYTLTSLHTWHLILAHTKFSQLLLVGSSQKWIFLCFRAHILTGLQLSQNSQLSTATDWLQVKVEVTLWTSVNWLVSFSVKPHLGPPLWREDGSVIYPGHSRTCHPFLQFFTSAFYSQLPRVRFLVVRTI